MEISFCVLKELKRLPYVRASFISNAGVFRIYKNVNNATYYETMMLLVISFKIHWNIFFCLHSVIRKLFRYQQNKSFQIE